MIPTFKTESRLERHHAKERPITEHFSCHDSHKNHVAEKKAVGEILCMLACIALIFLCFLTVDRKDKENSVTTVAHNFDDDYDEWSEFLEENVLVWLSFDILTAIKKDDFEKMDEFLDKNFIFVECPDDDNVIVKTVDESALPDLIYAKDDGDAVDEGKVCRDKLNLYTTTENWVRATPNVYYLYINEELNHSEAKEYCVMEKEAQLAKALNKNELDTLTKVAFEFGKGNETVCFTEEEDSTVIVNPVYVDGFVENWPTFIWSDGTNIPESLWVPHSPDDSDGKESCVALQRQFGALSDTSCKMDTHFICEIRCESDE